MRLLTFSCGLFVSTLWTVSALAQTMTSDELVDIFQKQIDVQSAPLTRSLDGTRGLSLITVEDVQAEPVSVSMEVTQPQTPEETVSGTIETTTQEPVVTTTATPIVEPAEADQNKPLIYAQLHPELQINLNIKFEFDSAALGKGEKDKLATMCSAMKVSSIKLFRIIGHTDTSGSDKYNERLSVLRAKEVARHLVQECGVAANRLETVGMGERFPINSTDTKADENRRVEFQALS